MKAEPDAYVEGLVHSLHSERIHEDLCLRAGLLGCFLQHLCPAYEWPASQRGSPPFKVFRLFLCFVLADGEEKSKDSRRKGRGWGISTVWAEEMGAKLEVSIEVLLFTRRGELWEAATERNKKRMLRCLDSLKQSKT